ncbi:MAG: flagellar hook protein FlgE [Pseudomonadota bacterium]
MSFTQGLSGLSAASTDLEVIGNNVANANTVGFKQSRAQFADVYAASLGGGAGGGQIGIGTKLSTVAQQFTQGTIKVTGNTLDIAINGAGFFIMQGSNGVDYSRNGQFQMDRNGFIVNSTGKQLTGWPASATGVVANSGPTAPLQISTANILPTQSSDVTVYLNLDSRVQPPSVAFDPGNTDSFNNSTSTTTYDSKGNAQINTLYFVKAPTVAASSMVTTPSGSTGTVASTAGLAVGQTITGGGFPAGSTIASITSGTTFVASQPATGPAAPATFGALTGNAWNVYSVIVDPTAPTTTPPSYLSPNPAPATPADWVAAGTLQFNTDGSYNNAAASAGGSTTPTTPTFTPVGSSAQTISYNFTNATQFGASFGVTKLSQNGNTSGSLTGFSTSAEGIIVGNYSNGLTKALGQIALATFPNNQGLQPLGDNLWAATTASGAPVTGVPSSGNNGVLQTGAVEESNTDLTTELVNMITAQRNYQANAQTIKTQDTVLQTLINLG